MTDERNSPLEGYPEARIQQSWEQKHVDLEADDIFSLGEFLNLQFWDESPHLPGLKKLPNNITLPGLITTLEKIGVGIEAREFPEGYGFLYFSSEAIGDHAFLNIKYDVRTQRAISVSAFNPEVEVMPILHPLLNEQSGTLSSIYKALELEADLSEPEKAFIDLVINKRKEERERRAKIISTLEQLPGITSYIPDEIAKEGVLVIQGEFTIKRLGDGVKSLRTFGLGPCIALVLYQPDSQMGAMYHIDIPGDESSRILEPITGALRVLSNQSEIKAYIVGGDGSSSSKNTIQAIVELLPSVRILEAAEINRSEFQNVALDLESGSVGHYSGNEKSNDDIALRLIQAEINARSNALLRQV